MTTGTGSLAVLLLTTIFLVPASTAQRRDTPGRDVQGRDVQGRDVQGASQGSGILKYEGQRDITLRAANLNLKRNGDLEIRLNGSDTLLFTGYWYAGASTDYDFELTGGFGNEGTYGRGSVSFKPNGQINHLEFRGYSQRQAFSVTFDGNNAGPGNLPTYPSYSKDSQYIGTYRSSERTQRGDQDFTIIRVLRIRDDGTVELASRFKGGEPVVNRETLTKHGNLLSDIRNRKTVLHTGTWRDDGRGNLELSLRRLDPEDRNDAVTATWRLRFRGTDRDTLQSLNWDRQLYGNTAIEFARVTGDDSEDPNPNPSNDNLPPPTDRIDLTDEGQGNLLIGRDNKRFINRVRAKSAFNDTLDVSFTLSDGNVLELTGKVVRAENRLITVRLTNAKAATASGTLTIEEANNGRIRRLDGTGILDGRSFTVEFDGKNSTGNNPNTDNRDNLNIFQEGNGLWTRERSPNMSIRSVSVITRANGEAEVSLQLSNSQRLLFSGTVEIRNANGLIIRLTNSGNSRASGTIDIEYGRNNSIENLKGDGTLEGSRFTIQFAKR